MDDILNINNVYFDNRVSQKYPSELQLNKTKTSDTKAAFLDLHKSIFKAAYYVTMNTFRKKIFSF